MPATIRLTTTILLALVACATGGALVPAPASAERCTFGFDQDPRIDRHPGACERSAAGGRTAAPIAAARDGRVWFFVRDDNGGWRARRASFDGDSVATSVTTSARPTGLTRGPDGALWFVAGDEAGRIAGDGSVDRFDLDARATGGIVTGSDDNLWYVARTAVVRLTTDGEATAFPVGARTAGGVAEERSERRPDNVGDEGAAAGITAGPDGAVWFSAYGSVGRVTPDGDVRLFDTILPADGGIAAGPARERAIYYTSFDAADVVRLRLPDGAQERFGKQPIPGTIRVKGGLTGRPVDIIAGLGRYTLWATLRTGSGSSIAGEKNIVARIHSSAFPFGRPPGEACDAGAPASCGSYMPAWPIGYSTSFNTHEIPEGGLVATGDDVWYPEGDSLGRIRAFRGIMKCTTTDPGQTERAAQLCSSSRPWVGDVNARGVTVARMSCPRLSLRYCAGHVTLSSSGAVIGGGDFIYQSYDNPAARLTLNMVGRRKLARTPGRRLTVTATLASHDAGGLEVTRTESLILVQEETPDLTRSPFRYIDHGGAPRVVVSCHPADGNAACGPVAVRTRDIVKLTLEGVRPRAGRVIEWDLNGDGTYENRDPDAFEQVQGWKVPARATIRVRVRDSGRVVYRAVRRFVITQGICQAGDSICRR